MSNTFVSDLEIPNQEYAVLIRSFKPGEKITGIKQPDLPEGVSFFSAQDLPGGNYIGFLNEKIRIFAEEETDYFGQPVGILTGPDKQELLYLRALFDIETPQKETAAPPAVSDRRARADGGENGADSSETQEPAAEPESSGGNEEADESQTENADTAENKGPDTTEAAAEKMEPAEPVFKKITEREPSALQDRITARQELRSGDAETVFEKSKHIISSVLSFEPRYHFHAESACVKTEWKDGRLEIHVASQWPFNILDSVCSALNIPKSKVNVVLHKKAESLDGKMWFPCLLAVQTAAAAFFTKKNIAVEFSRQENFLYTTKAPAVTVRHKTAVSDMGTIEAMNVSVVMDAGAYNPFAGEMLKQMVLTAAGIYLLPVFSIEAVAVKTAAGPTDLYLGWGDAYITASLEKHINEIAEILNLSPVQIRMDNLLRVKQERIYGEVKEEKFEFENLFRTVCDESVFFRKYYAYRALNKARKSRYDGNWRGIGIAAGLQYNGSHILVKAGMSYSAEVTLTKENTVIVKAEPTSSALKEILKKKIAADLETEEENVVFKGGSTDDMSRTGASTASCGISILPTLIGKCCDGIKKLKFRKPLPITVTKTYKPVKAKDWNSELLKGAPFISYTPGVCAVELELEPSTYRVKTRGIWFACNPGKVYSEQTVLRILHKSIVNALSATAIEKIRDGRDSAFRFKIISADEIPPIIKVFVSETGLKAVALSELAGSLVPAAYISALNQIMLNYDSIHSVPVFPEDIFEASLKAKEEVQNEG